MSLLSFRLTWLPMPCRANNGLTASPSGLIGDQLLPAGAWAGRVSTGRQPPVRPRPGYDPQRYTDVSEAPFRERLLLLDERHQPLFLALRHAGKVHVATVFAMGRHLPQQRQELLVLLL